MNLSAPWLFKAVLACSLLLLCACSHSFKNRPYYNRNSGDYRTTVSVSAKPESIRKQRPETRGSSLKQVADSYLGVPYRYGGQSRKGMDCSGFIGLVFQQIHSLKLPRKASDIGKQGKSVSRSELKEGDVVLFGSLFGIHHAGIFIEGNQFIHASTSRGVIYSDLNEKYYADRYKGARRLIF